jgi:hypothetical protein
MDIELGSGKSKGKGIGIVAAGIAVALAMVDFVVLRGDHVDSETIYLYRNDPAMIEINRVGEEHLLEISTRRTEAGETKGRSVNYRLEDPQGRTVAEETELMNRKKRFVRFEPLLAGEYKIFVEDPKLLGTSRGSVRVSVYVNDHRILARFLSF